MINKKTLLITLDNEVKDKLEIYSKESLIPKSSLINKLISDFLYTEECKKEALDAENEWKESLKNK